MKVCLIFSAEAVGYRDIATTQKYIGVSYASAREAVEGMALGKVGTDASDTSGPTFDEPDTRTLLSNSLKTFDDEILQSELEKRGYNVTIRNGIKSITFQPSAAIS